MSFKLTLLTTVISLSLLGCSPIHRTTDLNKIRSIYTNSENQAKISDIAKTRQQSIKLNEDLTAYSKKIQCLSPSYANSMEHQNKVTQTQKLLEHQGILDEIQRLKNDIQKITKTGGYQKLKINNQPNQKGEYVEAESKIFNLTINQYAILIKEMDMKIEFSKSIAKTQKDNQKLINLMHQRENYAFEFEELKNYLEQIQEELKIKDDDLKKSNKILEDLNNEKSSANDVFKVSVAEIYDKTGKVFDKSSTAISEMVAHALSYNYGIKLVDIPFTDNWSTSRYNPIKDTRHSGETFTKSPALFAGSVFLSDMYISGALVQYDELPASKPFGTRVSINLDPIDLSNDTRTITVGMILRAVGSNDALILDNAKRNDDGTTNKITGERASTYVQNTYFVKKIGVNMFEVQSKRLYGGNITVEVSDPATYVIKEMVEAGVYDLLKKTIRPDELRIHNDEICQQLFTNKITGVKQ